MYVKALYVCFSNYNFIYNVRALCHFKVPLGSLDFIHHIKPGQLVDWINKFPCIPSIDCGSTMTLINAVTEISQETHGIEK